MFREVARKKNALTREDGIELLKSTLRGVLSVQGDDGYPYGIPLNHWYNEEDGCLYFHSGPVGHKLDAMKRCPKVSFCVYDEGYREEGDWALKISSAVVFGKAEQVTDMAFKEEICRKLSAKFPVSKEETDEEIARSLRATYVFRVVPEHITCKRVREA